MRDGGGWDGGLSTAGVWRGLVNFGACGQVVVGISCDPEAPARVPVAMVGALKGGVEILWLLVSGTCLIYPAVLTSLVMLLSRTKSAYGGSDMFVMWGNRYDLELQKL
jgi:hypothetical protein